MIIKHAERDRLTRDAVVLDLGDLRRTAEAMEAAARARAAEIVRDAHAERERILAGAFEQGHTEGRTSGLEKGIEEGRTRGREEAIAAVRSEAAAAVKSWEEALGTFESRREEMILDARSEVLALAVTIAERITKRRVQVDPTIAADQLAAAIALTVAPSRLQVRTHPEDLEVARTVMPGLISRLTSSPNTTLDPDESISRGSIVLVTEAGEIDATIETQLDRIVQAILPARQASPPQES